MLALLVAVLTSCANVPSQYKDICVDGACSHFVGRCKQNKAAGNPHSRISIRAPKEYGGTASTDGKWLIQCNRAGKVEKILDAELKDVAPES